MPALRPCRACGAQVSSSATACPNCGHPTPKRTSLPTLVLGVLIGGVALVGVIGGTASRLADAPADSKLAPIVPAGPAPSAPPTPEEVKKTAERLRAAIGAKTLLNASKDPESFELKSVVAHPDGCICYDYRAKNSFNAMLAGSAVLTPKGKILIQEHDGNAFVREWNRGCTKDDGSDVLNIVKIMIKKT